MKPRKFCLLATQRTGSTYVRELLDSVPGVTFHGEIFNPQDLTRRIVNLGFSMGDRERDPLAFLAEVERLGLGNAPVFGFHLMIGYHPTVLEHVLSSEDYGPILLSRQNKLAQYSSFVIAMTSGAWVARRDIVNGPQAKILFDPNAFAEFIAKDCRKYDVVLARLRMSGRKYQSLEYAQIRDHTQIAALLAFMGVEPDRSISDLIDRNPYVRQNTPRIIDRFSNPETVLSAMREMGHEDWLGQEAT
jgi:LPS sulfotransferase NodH